MAAGGVSNPAEANAILTEPEHDLTRPKHNLTESLRWTSQRDHSRRAHATLAVGSGHSARFVRSDARLRFLSDQGVLLQRRSVAPGGWTTRELAKDTRGVPAWTRRGLTDQSRGLCESAEGTKSVPEGGVRLPPTSLDCSRGCEPPRQPKIRLPCAGRTLVCAKLVAP